MIRFAKRLWAWMTGKDREVSERTNLTLIVMALERALSEATHEG